MSSADARPPLGGECPFQVLEVSPTLELGSIKRAYFAALPRFPPHQDPAGFRRLRAAYEALSQPDARALAFIAIPIDAVAGMDRWNQRFAGPLARAAEQASHVDQAAAKRASFVETTSRLSLAEAIAAYSSSAREQSM